MNFNLHIESNAHMFILPGVKDMWLNAKPLLRDLEKRKPPYEETFNSENTSKICIHQVYSEDDQ